MASFNPGLFSSEVVGAWEYPGLEFQCWLVRCTIGVVRPAMRGGSAKRVACSHCVAESHMIYMNLQGWHQN